MTGLPFPVLCGLAVLIGLFVGSFLNVVIYRLPKMMERDWANQCAESRGEAAPFVETFNLAFPASRCPACAQPIKAWQNIPVLSYFVLLRGKCAHCAALIPLRYPLVELTSGLLTGFAVWQFGASWLAVGAAILIWALLALTFIDFDTQLLPDSITLPLLWAGLLFNLSNSFASLEQAVIGAAAGYLVLWAIFWLFKILTGKEGMGYGDFKLLAALGAWLGWTMLPAIILLSSLVGAAVGILLILLARHGRNVPIPFGPYLAAAGVIALFWGEAINASYLGLVY